MRMMFGIPGLCICFVCAFCTLNFAQSKAEEALTAYHREDYQTAAVLFEEMLASGDRSAGVYYNLGNCYAHLDRFPLAILNYERTLRLQPRHKDAQHNLRIARESLTEAVIPVEPFFLKQWVAGLQNIFSSTGWGILSILVFWAMIAGIVYGLLVRGSRFRLALPVWVPLMGVLLMITGFLGFRKYADEHSRNYGILMSETCSLNIAPDTTSKVTRMLSGGEKVFVLDTLDNWLKVRLANMEEGWVEAQDLTRI